MVDVAGEEKVKEQIRSRYGEAALRVLGGGVASCCGGFAVDPVCGRFYSENFWRRRDWMRTLSPRRRRGFC